MSHIFGNIVNTCRGFYFRTRESFSGQKRDLVVYRVEQARDSLETTKTQFESALQQFHLILDYENGDLDEKYRQMKHELDCSQHQAKRVNDRIRAVEKVSEALFNEWQQELEQYSSRSLRNSSRKQLKLTRQHYVRLIKAMHKAEDKITPVLGAFTDQVLFLKHNLNAQAIASLHHELRSIGMDIASLITAMEKSIIEANTFVASVGETKVLPQR